MFDALKQHVIKNKNGLGIRYGQVLMEILLVKNISYCMNFKIMTVIVP